MLLNELKNPCINCNHSWRAGRGSGCETCCKEYEIYQTTLRRKNTIEDAFYQKLDELHMQFYDWYEKENGQVTFNETKLIREIFRFIKSNREMIL